MIRAIAIDDEPKALEVIEILAGKVPFITVEATFTNAFQAIPYLQQNNIDLLFLDIHMPDISGLEFLRALPQRPLVIFTTAYAHHAVDAFELDAIDYLMKPFSLARFSKACSKALALRKPLEHSLFIKTGTEEEKIRIDDILYIVAHGNYLEYHLPQRKLVVRQTLHEALGQLPAEKFFRLHRSYIVSATKIEKISRTAVWINGLEIPVGASYEEDFLALRKRLMQK